MKQLWNEEIPAGELRRMLSELKDKEKRNELLYKLAVLGGILALVILAVVAVRHLLKSRYEDDEDDWDMDCECDENGCYYVDDEDFELDEEE